MIGSYLRRRREAKKMKTIAVLLFHDDCEEYVDLKHLAQGHFFSSTGELPTQKVLYNHALYLKENGHGEREIVEYSDNSHKMRMHPIYCRTAPRWLDGKMTHEEALAEQKNCDDENEDNE